MKKKRADELLYEHGHCGSREEGALLVMAGKVRSGKDTLIVKPSQLFEADAVLRVDSGGEFVSRGAYKLRDSLDKFAPDLRGRVAADIGASTGGFTDLMLSRGAEKVYAVDVGRGLLHWKLRSDPRVICLEGVNARTLSPEIIPEKIDVLTMDVSFISAAKLLSAADSVMKEGALAFLLVKPQFETPREDVPPGGVVTDDRVRRAALDKVCAAASGLGWHLIDASDSPLKGPKGNREYVALFRKGAAGAVSL
ncbi:MAG: 16S/23S rRNA (cytidine-2'-O)-methyltransferase TlyA [Lentisphaerae bacterium ADurb.Bin242]|nr:MAG: 16S/23S rRNA (cytidine-2'-O)-methyltransferase TlyA [Lentisphaerae bacterium ADurb.Bin242]